MSTDDNPDPGSQRPPLRLVRGDATPEEVAALLAVLSAAGGGEDPAPEPERSEWANPARLVRGAPGSGWRSSALPR
jgi:hypothetical protein